MTPGVLKLLMSNSSRT